ncbi:3802_t:CDS:2 [Ambispora gerdemannii]|uniref:sphingolipid C(9)-methyltransferase n=1 Tax=Ambispora gerdemannii TaxID=144530 RepID=A0A9N8WQT6_9GLOM|nr:3802_t:CDS:2 [Ambispora gerdemannii]
MSPDNKGIKVTNWAGVANAPFPAEGAGNQTFSNLQLISIVAGFFVLNSKFATPWNNKVQHPNRKLEEYIIIKDPTLAGYQGRNKIPMEIFFENYFDGKIDLNGDALEIMEARHDWASFEFGFGQLKFFLTQWIPETIWHSKKQDEDQVRDHYDRGDDFYEAFLGPRMIYTAGIVSDPARCETLEELQDNKLRLVCEKVHLKKGDRLLDIGCGWGTLVAHAAKNFDVDATGVTLGIKQTAYANNRIKEYGVKNPEQARVLCLDYRDIPAQPKYDKITCLEMAEHVGVRLFHSFLLQVRDLMEDDGLFFLQIAGLRRTWQYEDFIWGLFMAKYIFPGADASCPLYWVINQLETAGFEVQDVDTIGVHYSATIWRWYQNWLKNRDTITAKYGKR